MPKEDKGSVFSLSKCMIKKVFNYIHDFKDKKGWKGHQHQPTIDTGKKDKISWREPSKTPVEDKNVSIKWQKGVESIVSGFINLIIFS